jgi:hypothetical protein
MELRVETCTAETEIQELLIVDIEPGSPESHEVAPVIKENNRSKSKKRCSGQFQK